MPPWIRCASSSEAAESEARPWGTGGVRSEGSAPAGWYSAFAFAAAALSLLIGSSVAFPASTTKVSATDQSWSFNCMGTTAQAFTVPAGVSGLSAVVVGASGQPIGPGTPDAGKGGKTDGTLSVRAGEQLAIDVGCTPPSFPTPNNPYGFGLSPFADGGMQGGLGSNGGSGGGASAILAGSQVLVVGGGGGGQGGAGPYGPGYGPDRGGAAGGDGGDPASAGGPAGSAAPACGGCLTSTVGGSGQEANGDSAGGGGGGGYKGGAGGVAPSDNGIGGGGGGGLSFADPSVQSHGFSVAKVVGDGSVTLTATGVGPSRSALVLFVWRCGTTAGDSRWGRLGLA